MNIDNPSMHHIPQLKKLWKNAFGDSNETIDNFFNVAFSCDRCLCKLDNDNVVSVLYWFDCSLNNIPIAYIYAVATDVNYRGKGMCSNLMKYAHGCLADKGYGGAVLVPGAPELFAFYGRMGYNVCSGISLLNNKASQNIVDIHSVTPHEYEKLRKMYLPDDSVIQDGINTEYLSTEYELYYGDGFVFASKVVGDKVYSPEFLGRIEYIPQIINTLGCGEGTFRTPGNERAFAMWIPFDNINPPKYFGLAFD